MVGYKKDDSMSSNEKLVAGCLSGVVTRFITQPIDVVKLRTQLLKKKNVSQKLFGNTRRILAEEGITAFWQGHSLGQVHSVLAVSTQFYVYELSTKFIANLDVSEAYRPVLMFLCGSLAGACSTTLVTPMEVVRVRQMLVKNQYGGFLNGAKAVYKSGGFLAFYEGYTASMIQMVPSVGVSFSVFRLLQPLILSQFHTCKTGECSRPTGNHYKPEHLLVASTIAGAIAGFVSKTMTYPFDLAKRRMQIATHKHDDKFEAPKSVQRLVKCKKLSDCLFKTYRLEGIPGLYRGWKVTIYKAQVTSIVAFTTYELICYAVREIESK